MTIIILFLLLLILCFQSMMLMIDSLFIIDCYTTTSSISRFVSATNTNDIVATNSVGSRSGISKCILSTRVQPSFMTKQHQHPKQEEQHKKNHEENNNNSIINNNNKYGKQQNDSTKELIPHRSDSMQLLAFIPPVINDHHYLNSTNSAPTNKDIDLELIIPIQHNSINQQRQQLDNNNTKNNTTSSSIYYDNIMKWFETIFTTPTAATLEKKMTETIEKIATKASKKSSSGIGMLQKKIIISSSTPKAATKTAKHVGERWLTSTERKMMSTSMKAAAVHNNKNVPYTLLERIVNRFKKTIVTSPVKHSTERIINRNTQRLFTPRSSSKVLIRQHHKVLERTVERYGKRSIGQRLVLLGSSSLPSKRSIQFISKTMLLRFGNLCLIALPILGGLFSCSLCYHDIHRVIDEHDISTQIMFALAGIADFLDAIIHFIITYVLIRQVQYPKMIHFIENISTKCMYISTISVILGEIFSTILQHRQQQQQQRQDMNNIKNNNSNNTSTTSSTILQTTETNAKNSIPPAPVSS